MDNGKTYIQILVDTQVKKTELLKNLTKSSEEQESLLDGPDFDLDEFNKLVRQKDKDISKLNELDNGFEKLYKRVGEELQDNKYAYKDEIEKLKETITNIADLSIKLETKEKANKVRLETYLSNQRKEIKDFKKSKLTASNYKKSMSDQDIGQAHFFDTKK